MFAECGASENSAGLSNLLEGKDLNILQRLLHPKKIPYTILIFHQ